jgi:hypothetical protein
VAGADPPIKSGDGHDGKVLNSEEKRHARA